MKKTFLVTGASGFLGAHLIQRLLNDGYQVIGIKRKSSQLWRLQDVLNYENLKLYDVDEVDRVFQSSAIDCVIHTVCSYGRNNESLVDIVKTNLLFGLEIFELAKNNNVNCFFNTDTLLQKDLNNYSLSKKQFVEWIYKNHGYMQVFNMRIEHMYGVMDDSNKFITWIVEQLKNNVSVIDLTSGIQKRDFVYVTDVVNAYLTVFDHRETLEGFQNFDVATGTQICVKDFVSEIFYLEKKRNPDLSTVLNFGAKAYRKGEQMEVQEDVTPLKKLGWKPEHDYRYNIELLLEENR